MKVIFLQVKYRVLAILFLISMGILFYFDYKTENSITGNGIIIYPKNEKNIYIDRNSLEDINSRSFLLTYVKYSKDSISSDNRRTDANIVETDYIYNYICNHKILWGSFLTKAHDEKSTYAVLNEKAAFDLFGNSFVTGEKVNFLNKEFTIIGVINDADNKNATLYTAFSESEEKYGTYIAMEGKKIDSIYIKDTFKNLGINDTNYDFINLAQINQLGLTKILLSLDMMFLSLALISAVFFVQRIGQKTRVLKNRMEEYYFFPYLKENKKEVLFYILTAAAAFISVLICIWAFTLLFKYMMILKEGASIFKYISNDFPFIQNNAEITAFNIYGNCTIILSAACAFTAMLMGIIDLLKKSPSVNK